MRYLAAFLALMLSACSSIDVKDYWPNPSMAGSYRLSKLTGNHDGWAFSKLAPGWEAFSITDVNCSVDYYFWITPTEQSREGLIQPVSSGSTSGCPSNLARARFAVPPLLWMLPRFIDPKKLPLVITTTARDVFLDGATTGVGTRTVKMEVRQVSDGLYTVEWADTNGNGETLWAGMTPFCSGSGTAPGIVRYHNTWGNDATYCWSRLAP